jgi:alpha-tubulin suppressor-like RCC1 family protein
MSVLLGKPVVNLGAGKTATKIVAGSAFNCALLNDGTVKCWGENSAGQLGQNNIFPYGAGTATASCSATTLCSMSVITALTAASLGDATGGATIADISAGSLISGTTTNQVCMIFSTGKVKCIGSNSVGQLGIASSTTATAILNIGSTATAVSTSSTAASINAQSATATTAPYFTTLTNIGTSVTPSKITGGGSSFCSLMTNNEVKCWGYGASGQLGSEATGNLGTTSAQLGENLLSVIFAGAR